MPRNLRPSTSLAVLSFLLTGGGLDAQVRAAPHERWSPWPPSLRLALPADPAPPPRVVRWYHGVAALGAVALASAADQSLRDELQAHRTGGKDDVARFIRRMGEPAVYGGAVLGTLATGVVLGDGRIQRASGRIAAGLVTAGVVTNLLKPTIGRQRPSGTTDAFRFRPFSGRESWPSGHTTMAFALATTVGDEIHVLPLSLVLYGAAGLTAWSRLNDNRHWGSDVLAGALIGISSGKLMNGRWRVFGISAPRFLLEPGGVGLTAEF